MRKKDKIEKLLELIRGQLPNYDLKRQQQWMEGEEKFIKQLKLVDKVYGLIVSAKVNAEFKIIIPNIVIDHAEIKTNMGDYILWFKWDYWSSCFSIVFKAYNIDRYGRRRIGQCYHPHINQGRPCRGDFLDTWENLRVSNQIMGLLTISKQFLETYNSRNPYHNMNYHTSILIESEKYGEYKWEGPIKMKFMVNMQNLGLQMTSENWDILTERCFEISQAYDCSMEQSVMLYYSYLNIYRAHLRRKIINVTQIVSWKKRDNLAMLKNNNGHYFKCTKNIYLTDDLFLRLEKATSINGSSPINLNNVIEMTPVFCSELPIFKERDNQSNWDNLDFFPDYSDQVLDEIKETVNDINNILQEVEYYIRRQYLAWLYDESGRIKHEVIRFSPNGEQNNLFTEQVEKL